MAKLDCNHLPLPALAGGIVPAELRVRPVHSSDRVEIAVHAGGCINSFEVQPAVALDLALQLLGAVARLRPEGWP